MMPWKIQWTADSVKLAQITTDFAAGVDGEREDAREVVVVDRTVIVTKLTLLQ
jgi:hypothetical protein